MPATEGKTRSPILVRAAVSIGEALGRWQRKRAAKKDDAFVKEWKAAWTEGCEAHTAGKAKDDVPYPRAPHREAWIAGWIWSERHRERS